MQEKKKPISTKELINEIKENGFKNIYDGYVDRVVFYPDLPGMKIRETAESCSNLHRQFIKVCARVSKGATLDQM